MHHINTPIVLPLTSNMPVQGEELVQRIKMDSTVNFMLDWKMVTLFIGQNDICDYCKHPVS